MADAADALTRMTGPGGVRELVARWVVTTELVLESAAHLGAGERGDVVDAPLLRDRIDHRPLLTGSSLAGALRSHLDDRRLGFGVAEEAGGARALFGAEGAESPLIVFDSRGNWPERMSTEVRDGVAVSPAAGTAEENSGYDVEVLPPGTTFPLRFELLVGKPEDERPLLADLAAALGGLERGEVSVGARRSRGLGAGRAVKWRARRFDLTGRLGWIAWLTSDHEHPNKGLPSVPTLAAALTTAHHGLRLDAGEDKRDRVVIEAELQFKGGLLVRSPGRTATSPDASHLHSAGEPVLPGTGVAGALRARALRIARQVRERDADRWVTAVFGSGAAASRLLVSERPVTEGQSLRQGRVRGDRFTGGVVGGEFDEEPVFRGKARLRLELRRPRTGEVGLLLLVLKDLLTGDLPLGGTASVGRGVVGGRAEVFLPGQQEPYRFDPLVPAAPETAAALNRLVDEFRTAEGA